MFGIITFVVIIGAVLWFTQSCWKSTDVSLEKYNKDIAAYQDTNKFVVKQADEVRVIYLQTKHESDSVKALADARKTTITRLTTRIDSLKTKNDSLFKVASQDTSVCVNLCFMWKTIAINYRAVVDSQIKVISEKDIQYADQVEAYRKLGISFHSADSTVGVLTLRLNTQVPVYKEEKFLGFIPLPSRKASFGLGAATVLVLEGALYMAVHK